MVRDIAVTLKPESAHEKLNVQGTASSITTQTIDTASAVHQGVVGSQDLEAIPLPARSFANIAYLVAGTEPVEPSDPTKARITAVSTGGSSGLNNELSVDGADNSDDWIGGFLQNFSPAIVALNSAGSFDGEICCYAVTFSDIVPDCGSNGSGQGGFNPGTGVGMGTTAFATSSASVGGAGAAPPACASSCVDAITNGGTPCADPGLSVWEALLGCACSGAVDGCDMECGSLCQNSSVESQCLACAMMNCASQLATCDSN